MRKPIVRLVIAGMNLEALLSRVVFAVGGIFIGVGAALTWQHWFLDHTD